MNWDGPTIGALAAMFFGLAKLLKAASKMTEQLFFDSRTDDKKRTLVF